MNLSYNFVSFIDALGVVQGVLFGFMLLFLNVKENKPTLFLGLFIILFSLEPVVNILEDLNVLAIYPSLELLPVNFHFLAFPLFYIYIQKISILKIDTPSYWTLFPGVIEFILGVIVFLFPVDVKLQIKSSLFANIYFTVSLLYSIYIGFLTIRLIVTHRKEVLAQYAKTESKQLDWCLQFIVAAIVFQILLLTTVYSSNTAWYLFISIINIILIYWVSFKGITQSKIDDLVWNSAPSRENATTLKKDSSVTKSEADESIAIKKQQFMDDADVALTINKVKNYIEKSHCYYKENLTIIDISEAIDIHPKRISYALNSELNLNFNNLINSYRVKKAELLLKDDSYKNLSIEGIGLEVGFHSKTSFYNAFKKITGTTPAKYKSA